ncbi:MAG: RsmD family RNA methyltransferase [Armatimonadetes bacterium]|nr:RsmD family RNA methyltransferase [Armatimonadota bacterium]
MVLSHYQADVLLKAREDGLEKAKVSPDLGLTKVEAALADDGVMFPGGELLDWPAVERISGATRSCFLVCGGEAEEVRALSEMTGLVLSLVPTGGAPTLFVSGFPMHRIKGTDPHRDTRRKIEAISPIRGRVLDTATGLGYTAIEAARTAEEVTTIELDPAVLEIARVNPWSKELFDNAKIKQIIGDATVEVEKLPAASFNRIIHDPPTLKLAGEMYSGALYSEFRRVLTRRGRTFHYVGDPDSALGARNTRGVIRRLREAGFRRVSRAPEAFGVVAEP